MSSRFYKNGTILPQEYHEAEADSVKTEAEREEEAMDEEQIVDFEAERAYVFDPGEEWEPPGVVLASTPGRDGVPTVDDDLDMDIHAAPRYYPNYRAGETYVVTRPVGIGTEFPRWRDFAAWALDKFGVVLEWYAMNGRASARVYKPGFGNRKEAN